MNANIITKSTRGFSGLFGTIIAALVAVPIESRAASIIYTDFSSVAGLTLNEDAAQVGTVLRLTPSLSGQSGSAFSTTPVSLAADVSFSTYFQFRISNPGGITDIDGVQGADGIVFAVQTVDNTAGGAGGGIGFAGIDDSAGVEFDTWSNTDIGDINGNHIGIDLDGSVSSVAAAAIATPMNNGEVWHAWVDYDGTTDLLEVRLSDASLRPAAANLGHVVDLSAVLGSTSAFVGFTSGTGAAYNDHDILTWEFRDTFDPIEEPPTDGVPESGHSFVLLALACCALISASTFRRRNKRR